MKILFVGYADHRAAGMIHLHHFANELVELGQQVLALMHGDLSHAQTLRQPPLYAMDVLRYERGLLAPDLMARARQFAPDVVHAWTPRNLPARAGLELSIACKAPLIIHYEDDEEELYRAHVGDVFSNRADFLDSWQHPDWHPHYFHPAFSPAACRMAAGFTAICQPLIPRLEQYWVKPAHLLYPGVDLQQFSDDLRPEDALVGSLHLRDKQVILYSGPLNEMHDFQTLIEAVALLRHEFPDVMIVHVGQVFTPQLLDAPLDRLGMRERVRFVGHVMHKDVPRYLALADVLVQTGKPGAYNESRLPSKLPEYMAMGKPIITFSVGFGRLLADGVEVLKTYSDNAEELRGQLARLLRDSTLRQRLGVNARSKAAQLFNWRKNTGQLLRFYAQMQNAGFLDVPQAEVSRARFALSKAPMDDVRINIAVVGNSPRAFKLTVGLTKSAPACAIYPGTFNVRQCAALPDKFMLADRPSVIVFADGNSPLDAASYLARICVWEVEGSVAPAPGYDALLRGDADDPDALMQLETQISRMAWLSKPLHADMPPAGQPTSAIIATEPQPAAALRYRNRQSYLLAEVARNYEAGGLRQVMRYTARYVVRR